MQTCEIVVPKFLERPPVNKRDKPYNTISLLIQNREYQKAQDLLYCVPENDEHWHYLNALIHFCISGDTIISRTALTNAMTIEPITPFQLIGGYPVEVYLAKDTQAEISPEKIEYWAVTRPAWAAANKAFKWLEENCRHPLAIVNRELSIVAEVKGDIRRWERWQRYYKDGEKQFQKGDFELAIKSFEKAVENAEQIIYSYYPFTQSMLWLILITLQLDKPTEALEERISARIRSLGRSPMSNDPLLALHWNSVAKLTFTVGKFELAEKYFGEAIRVAAETMAQNRRPITLYEDLQIKQSLALTLFALGRPSEAIAQVLKSIALKSLYLGEQHQACADDFKMAYQIYSGLDDQKGKNDMCAKLTAIRERQYHYFRDVTKPA